MLSRYACYIKERKGLKKNQNILDFMGSTELAANLFRATQTEEKLRRENIQGKKEGIVVRPTEPVFCPLISASLSMKIVSNKYLLKNEE